ncbi:exonuclease SbcCD subunit D [Eubacteriaceae bacterium ES2]|nr:exonuclease SbcCD subunit D [Eubacteriaceae bacterium ES2]
MKFMHLSDLHIGKRIHEFLMLEDQKYILSEIIKIAQNAKVEGVIIAGDIYDKPVPSAEAVDLFDNFLTSLAKMKIPVLMISGNHDSPERLDFGSRIMANHQVHIAGQFNGKIEKISFDDQYGSINVFLMPFLKPVVVNRKLSLEAKSYDECVREALKTVEINSGERNILIAHQFVTAGGSDPERSDSEVKTLGGSDNVDVSAFAAFDYVALGHIHRPQKMGLERVRYCGSPLKYSFSEAGHQKSVTIVELREKGELNLSQIALIPRRDLKEIRTSLPELRAGKTLNAVPADCYVHIILTDEEEIIDAIGKVRDIYPNVMILDFDNCRSRENEDTARLTGEDLKQKSPLQLFSDFYLKQNNIEMTGDQKNIFTEISEQQEERLQ